MGGTVEDTSEMTSLNDPALALSDDEVPNWRTDLRPGIYIFYETPNSYRYVVSIKAGNAETHAPNANGISVAFLEQSGNYHFYRYPLKWKARLYYPTNEDIAEAVRLKMEKRNQL